jgi:hypothetical protein
VTPRGGKPREAWVKWSGEGEPDVRKDTQISAAVEAGAIVRVEETACYCGNCPKILLIEGDDEWVFVVGKRPSERERSLVSMAQDEDMVKYPRRSLLVWAIAQSRSSLGPVSGGEESA